MVPKETSWKRHAWSCVPTPGTVFSCGCETGFGSCSVSLDQGQVNCSLRLEIKLSSQTKNTKHLTRKRQPMEIQLSWGISFFLSFFFLEGFLFDLRSFLHWIPESMFAFMYVCAETGIQGIMERLLEGPALQKELCFCACRSANHKTWVRFVFVKHTTS